MKKYTIIPTLTLILLILPLSTAMATFADTKELILSVGDIVQMLTILAVALALLAFFWGLARFIFRIGGDEKAVEEGKRIMMWGIVALFVMISIWGVIAFIQGELGLPVTVPGGGREGIPDPGPGFPGGDLLG